jgi:hypothetical protein
VQRAVASRSSERAGPDGLAPTAGFAEQLPVLHVAEPADSAGGVVQRSADLGEGVARPKAGSAASHGVLRQDSVVVPAAEVVQRVFAAPAQQPVPAVEQVPVVARSPEPSAPEPVQRTAEAPQGETAQGQNADELLRKLYDPLLRRLKADLWLDRERRGALTDL